MSVDQDVQRLYDEGLAAFKSGDDARCEALTQQALAKARQVGDREGEALALIGQSRVALRQLDFQRVQSLSHQSLLIGRELGKRDAEVMPLHMLAEAARLQGRLDEAERLYDESLTLNEELGDRRMVAVEHHNKAYVFLARNDLDRGDASFRRSLEMCLELGVTSLPIFCLAGLACVSIRAGDAVRAARLFGAAERRMRDTGLVPDPADKPEFDRHVALTRRTLGHEAYSHEWHRGAALADKEAFGPDLALLRTAAT